MKFQRILAVLTLAAANQTCHATEPRIAWFGTLQSGLAEAKQSGRPILLVSGAPQCLGVPGVW